MNEGIKMWSRSYTHKVKKLKAAQVWKVWSNVNAWHEWQKDVEFARLEGEFKEGNRFEFRPKGGPTVNIELFKIEPEKEFVDLTRFPFARMYGSHTFSEKNGELEITTTMSVEGPLGFLWRKLVAEGIVAGLKEQTEWLIERATHA